MLTSLSFYSRSTAGGPFPLRLTEMLDPELTSYSWRVPNLPTDAACLRLRVGEDDDEVMLRPGPVFELASDSKAPIGRITFQYGEWWPTEGIAVEPHDVEVEPWWSDQEPRGMDQWPRPRSPRSVRMWAPCKPRHRSATAMLSRGAPVPRFSSAKVAPQPPSPSESRPSFGRCHERPLSRHHPCTEPPQRLGTAVWFRDLVRGMARRS